MKRKGETNDKDLPGGNPDTSIKSPIERILPVFDFSKRESQAAFWMLLNTVLYDKPDKSLSARNKNMKRIQNRECKQLPIFRKGDI